ncbi:MAG: hypothetical protein KZQ95_12370 [Candidatus Thiodiazotropha sp. (ex Epidulcina cf. delphinae)]|nr:hypothetical protein [Candidatus Thiodiazotropha sp. (ex Epidulcina cf. delphinae)]
MSTESFSKRHGYNQPSQVEIAVRQDAPHEFRGVIINMAYECGFSPSALRSVICKTLRKRADRNNWSEYPNIDDENHYLIDGCQWYKVYDIAEAIYKKMEETPFSHEPEIFGNDLNEYFIESGIGWKLTEGLIESRGSEGYENIIKATANALAESGRNTARNELHEAVSDLSRRPNPDITGAIQHSMASLECVARETCGDPKATLGEILSRHKDLIPSPLDQAISKAWGYASENARHIREGREPSYGEAELIVGICASVSTYLSGKEKA